MMSYIAGGCLSSQQSFEYDICGVSNIVCLRYGACTRSSTRQVLNKDITRVLTTILMATTVCTIYNAALFTNLAIQVRFTDAVRLLGDKRV